MLCIFCNSSCHVPYLKQLRKCVSCHLVWADESHFSVETEHIYEEDHYFQGSFQETDYVDYLGEKCAIQKNFKKRLREMADFISEPSQKSLFEVGSGFGFFLDLAQHQFRTVSGMDLSPSGCQYASNTLKLNVEQGNFLKKELPEKVDVFCMWDTVEHLVAPQLYIEKASESLKNKGFFHLTTGDIDSWNAKLRGSHWRLIHPPTHLYYFSKKTISQLLAKYGLEVKKILYVGNYRSLQAYLKVLGLKMSMLSKRPSRVGSILQLPIPLNLYDIMHVVAQKK